MSDLDDKLPEDVRELLRRAAPLDGPDTEQVDLLWRRALQSAALPVGPAAPAGKAAGMGLGKGLVAVTVTVLAGATLVFGLGAGEKTPPLPQAAATVPAPGSTSPSGPISPPAPMGAGQKSSLQLPAEPPSQGPVAAGPGSSPQLPPGPPSQAPMAARPGSSSQPPPGLPSQAPGAPGPKSSLQPPPGPPSPSPAAAVQAGAARPASEAATTERTTTDDSFHQERLLVDDARQALRDRRFPGALTEVERHQAQFPRGRLTEEREAIAIRAYAGLGRWTEARSRIARFRQAFPGSVLLPLVDATEAEAP